MLPEREHQPTRGQKQPFGKVNQYDDHEGAGDILIGQTQQEWQELMEAYEKELQAKKNSSLGEQSNSSISSGDSSESTIVPEEEAQIKMNATRVYAAQINNQAEDATHEMVPFHCTSDVSQCLEQLVEAVAEATGSHQLTYETFKLNEVVLAETRSSTSESEDEFPWQIDVKLVGEFCLEQAEFELNKQHVINLAQDYYAIQKASNAQQTIQVNLTPGTSEWRDAEQAIDCLASERFVVWIAEKPSEHCDELDLDDIALALNEPIPSTAVGTLAKQDVRVIIWHCSSPADARRIEALWRNSIRGATAESQTSLEQADESRPIEVSTWASSTLNQSGGSIVPPGGESSINSSQQSKQTDLKSIPVDKPTSDPSSLSLANYYRTVARRVMTNGSTKLKSLNDEMLRLNGGRQSLAKSTRRLSTALQNQPAGRGDEPPARCVIPPKVRPRTSVLKASASDKASGCQVTSTSGCASATTTERQPRSILKKTTLAANKQQSSRATQVERMSQVERIEHVNGGGSSSGKEDVPRDERQRVKRRPDAVLDVNGNLEQDSGAGADSSAALRYCERILTLRAGSTSSVTSRSRQRRPALLLRDEEAVQSAQPSAGDARSTSPSPLPAKITSSSKVDGLVRAKVSASHLRRSASMKMIDAASGKQQQQVVVASAPAAAFGTKKSEFDPRSLRRLPSSKTGDLTRTLARQRRSVANFQALMSSPSDDEIDDQFATIEEGRGRANDSAASTNVGANTAAKLTASKLAGSMSALSMLRQSFNQKNLSAMLKFSAGRESFRVKAADLTTPLEAVEQTRPVRKLGHELSSPSSREDLDQLPPSNCSDRKPEKAEALRLAEAKLQAAKKLKQQAQKLREQQKRVEQQQQLQQTSLDSVAMLFYQQQIQKQQQQQQQLIYHHQQQHHHHQQHQQQLLFDPVNVQLRQQQLFAFQRQQEQHQQQLQQLAYMSSAHFMAQHVQQPTAAAAAAAVANYGQLSHMYPMAQLAGPAAAAATAAAAQSMLAVASVPQLHALPGTINHSMSSSTHGAINSSHNNTNKPLYHQTHPLQTQNQQQQHYIPMSVNHHSSFNIVYNTATASPSSQAAAAAAAFVSNQRNPFRNQHPQAAGLNMTQNPQLPTDDESALFRVRKHSSLGASVRKTVRNILSKTSSSTPASHQLNSVQVKQQAALAPLKQKPLKSALKQAGASSAAKERDLNSEGSDADEASSTSDSTVDCSRPMPHKSVLKKSMIREQDHRKQFTSSGSGKKEQIPPSSSSDSSLASSSSSSASSNSHKSSTLTRNDMEQLRKEFIRNESSQCGDTHHRKNVTFSSQLISIL